MRDFFQSYRSPILFLLVLILSAGAFYYQKIQVSLFPEVTFPKLKIIAEAGDQPVDKMMITVTKPIEEAVKRVPDLKMLRSTTSRGSCELSVFLNWNADINYCQQQMESRLSEIQGSLPAGTQITTERMNPSILPVIGYSLESDSRSLIELKQIGQYTIKPFLSQLDGIASVVVQGGKNKEYWVELDPGIMATLHLSPEMVETAVRQSGFIASDGYVEGYRRLYLAITDAGLYKKEDIEDIIIQVPGMREIFLKDIARVRVQEQVEYVTINANGKEAVLINILRQPNANLVDIAREVDGKMAELKGLLPSGVKLKPFYRQDQFVETSIRSVTDAIWIGLFLSVIVSILFLRTFKPSLTILLIIPVTLALSFFVFYQLHYTLNIMTLGAIAASLGLIIDDAVVVVEQIFRTSEEKPGEPLHRIVSQAMRYLLPAIIGSSLSTILVFLPFSLMGGVAGAYFRILAYSMIIVLSCSFLVVTLGLPVVYMFLGKIFKGKPIKQAQQKNYRWVKFFIYRPYIAVLIILLMVVSVITLYNRLQTGFLPEMDEGSIVLDFNSPPGTSLQETDMMLRKVDGILDNIPEVESYTRRTGTQMGFFITEQNRGDYLIHLKDKRKLATVQVIDMIRQKVEETVPSLVVDFGQVIGDMLGDLMSSVQPIEIKVYGQDYGELKKLADKVAGIVERTKGTADVFNGIVIAGPYLSVLPDAKALHRYNLSPADLNYQVQTLINGTVVGSVQEKEQLTNVRMIYPGRQPRSPEDISNSMIYLKDGGLVPFNQLAKLKAEKGVSELERENLQPIIAVTARLNNRDLGSVMQDIQHSIHEQIILPKEYGVIYGGEFAEQQSSFKDLVIILILAIILVLLVMLMLFRKMLVAFLILFISVLGISGSILALYITGTPLNVGSYTGIIMIVGIIAENAVFTYYQYKENLKHTNKEESIEFAIATRLRPKLMTALSAITALLPLAMGIGTGAQMHQPLAIAVIGGFIVALPLLLIVLPSLIWKLRGV